jgi:ribonucleoside-diphosphate reductase alpha chain
MEISNKILSDITVYMKYAKYMPELNRRETWEELVTRNKNMHIKKYPKLKDEIETAYKFVYDKKVLPSMRSLQFGGKPIEISPNRIYNCAYLPIDDYRAFGETMFSETSCRQTSGNQKTKCKKNQKIFNCRFD